MAYRQSGTFDSRDPTDRVRDLTAGVALRLQHLLAGWREPVVPAPALARLLDPAALDPAALLEAIQQRIERRDAELQHTARARFDQLAEVVAVARLILDERQDEQLRASLLQLAIEHSGFHVLHSDILLKSIGRSQGFRGR